MIGLERLEDRINAASYGIPKPDAPVPPVGTYAALDRAILAGNGLNELAMYQQNYLDDKAAIDALSSTLNRLSIASFAAVSIPLYLIERNAYVTKLDALTAHLQVDESMCWYIAQQFVGVTP